MKKCEVIQIKSGQVGENTDSHLYLVSNEEIKTGDWVVISRWLKDDYSSNPVRKVDDKPFNNAGWFNSTDCNDVFKIVATTNKNLELPLIPQQWFKDYCKNPVTSVMVKFLPIICTGKFTEGFCNKCGAKDNHLIDYCWATTGEQMVLLSPVKQSWTMEEIMFWLENNIPVSSGYEAVLDKLYTVEEDLNNYIEDARADMYINEQKSNGYEN